MADRRMFHKNIVESDSFLDMPTSAQALYFHINMYADDDGFVNGPRRIARIVGACDTDLQMLISKRFLLAFDNGVVVVKHWRVANSLKNDRAKMPQYPELAAQIYIKDNRSYTDNPAEGGASLLEYKQQYLALKRIPGGFQGEVSKTEDITEPKIVDVDAGGFPPVVGNSTDLSTGESPTTTTAQRLRVMHGALGKGVLCLTDSQIDVLLEKMGLDMFDYYVDKLSSFIIQKGAKVKNHYATILKWWMEDSQDGGGQYESL